MSECQENTVRNWFEYLWSNYRWKPIWGCPGRFVLASGVTMVTVEELTEGEIRVQRNRFRNAADPVIYCFFEGGGLISYEKPGGYLHTLCDCAGMEKKMALLQETDNHNV